MAFRCDKDVELEEISMRSVGAVNVRNRQKTVAPGYIRLALTYEISPLQELTFNNDQVHLNRQTSACLFFLNYP